MFQPTRIEPWDFYVKFYVGHGTKWYRLDDGYKFQKNVLEIRNKSGGRTSLREVIDLAHGEGLFLVPKEVPNENNLALYIYEAEDVGSNVPHWELYILKK